MSLPARSMASLAILPLLLPSLVSAIPAADPAVTPRARLEERANGANIIGYSSSGTGWRTRSCNNGFFSSSGTIGNCCVSANCDFITTCIGSSVFYQSATAANCGNLCGTGTIYHTQGDSRPIYMFNCDFDWTVTMTPVTTTSTTATSRTQTVTATATVTPDPTTVITTKAGVVATTAAATSSAFSSTATSSSTRQVTLTVTDSAGSTSVRVLSASSSASSTPLSQHNNTSTSKTGLIAGVVVGVIIALALIAIAVFLFLRHRSKRNQAAAPAPGQAEYMAPNVGGGPPPQFNQVPPMAGTYQQNQYYGKDGQAAWNAPGGGMQAQQDQNYYKPQDQYGNSREVQTSVTPVHPTYPSAHEMAGSPVSNAAPVELAAHSK